jgi:hypothetical protein
MNWRTYDQAMSELSALPAEERLQALITVWGGQAELLSLEDMRKLFVYAWPDGRGSVDDGQGVLLGLLRFIAPVRDRETYLSGGLTIFRAGANTHGVCWSLDKEAATAEAAGGTLSTATVGSAEVLGHFTGDGRNDVLVDWQQLSIKPVA